MTAPGLRRAGMCAAVLSLALVLWAPGARADFDSGWQAYQKGEFSTALKEWTPLAEVGDARAMFNLGTMYDEGKGVERDLRRAADLWGAAADGGYMRAQHNLAHAFISGDGVERDLDRAVHWLHAAAHQGFDKSQYTLGKMFRYGLGVPRDHVRAFGWI